MAIADKDRKRWRVTVLLFTGAFVGAVIFAAAHKKTLDEPHDAVTAAAQLPPSHSENRVTLSTRDAANETDRVNAALQKAGPPDPVAERSAAESAERAADAAAALAASAGGPNN
jgi:hypothetical protein